MLAHERVWDEMQKHVREKTSRLKFACVCILILDACLMSTHSKSGHGMERVPVNLCRNKSEDEIRHAGK